MTHQQLLDENKKLKRLFDLACKELEWMAERENGKARYIQLIGHEEKYIDWRAKNPNDSTDDLSTWEDRILSHK